MVALAPPRKYWAWLILGILLVIVLTLLFYIPLLWSLVVAAILAASTGQLTLRRFFAFAFWLVGAEFVFVGILVALGATVGGVIALSAALLVVGWLLAIILIVVGIVLFIIGNFIID